MGSSPELLAVRGLGKSFPNGGEARTVLEEVSFQLSSYDSLAVVGPSGCGKTTLLLMLCGLLPPTKGSVWLDGEPLSCPSRKVALVLQEYGLFPWKTVSSNITLGAEVQKIRVPPDQLDGLKRELGIESLDQLYPHQLSGGQRQRVALARALLLRPRLLLLDEPFAALDTITRERLQGHILALFHHRQFSFIVVTHNIEEGVFLGRRILLLDGQERRIKTIVDNPGAGNPDYRNSPEFFQRVKGLREILEDSAWNGHGG